MSGPVSDESISVLIVEDDADFRDSSARWMQRKGHQVAAAASGAEALSLCSRPFWFAFASRLRVSQ